jgi:hypothetical protein
MTPQTCIQIAQGDDERWYVMMNGSLIGNRAGYVTLNKAVAGIRPTLNSLYAYDPTKWAGAYMAR